MENYLKQSEAYLDIFLTTKGGKHGNKGSIYEYITN